MRHGNLQPLDPNDLQHVACGRGLSWRRRLLVAKLHKLGDRDQASPDRLEDKDAHDVYRLLVAIETAQLSQGGRQRLGDELAENATLAALDFFDELFASGPERRSDARWPAGQKILIGDPAIVIR